MLSAPGRDSTIAARPAVNMVSYFSVWVTWRVGETPWRWIRSAIHCRESTTFASVKSDSVISLLNSSAPLL